MNFQEFMQDVLSQVQSSLDKTQRAEIQQVRKNNDVLMHGLTIYSEGSNITPTIYLEAFFKLYQDGIGMVDIVNKIHTVYKESMPKENINMDFFRDFEKVKDRIVYRLIHAEKNRELLKEIPHIPFWDLAICFSYAFWSEELGEGMILIHNNHMENWNVNYRQLMQLAEANTPLLFPIIFYGMDEVLKQMHVDIDLSECIEEPFYVLTNRQKVHGAAVILYPQTLLYVAEQLKSDYYIIPSSIHEVLIFKCEDANRSRSEGKTLHEMIKDINQTQLSTEEVLSDYPFFYSRSEKKLTQIK